ncbi:MAG: hypothetical protein H7202_11270, partial [Pedobacter sp.]|nr:hypothetical protein [Pedobacter sp.]
MLKLNLKAAELAPGLLMVSVFDEVNDLLCSMAMPSEIWNDTDKRRNFIYKEFKLEAERMAN